MPRNYNGTKQKVLALLVECHRTGDKVPTYKQIAADLGLVEASVGAAVYWLKEAGTVSITSDRKVARVRI